MVETVKTPVHAMTFQQRRAHVPAAAMRFSVGLVRIGNNGKNTRSAPVSAIVCDSKPAEHWHWGRIVLDLAGMKLRRKRLPLTWGQAAGEVIGYLNRICRKTGGDGVARLECSGALVPRKGNGKAAEIVASARTGVAYQASVDLAGVGASIEEVKLGASVEVNGCTLEGPACIIREWPLRGVAICPCEEGN